MKKSIEVLTNYQAHITPGAKGDVIISVEFAQALKDAVTAMQRQILVTQDAVEEAIEIIGGYCDKHSQCAKGCRFFDGDWRCLFQLDLSPCDWVEERRKFDELKKNH